MVNTSLAFVGAGGPSGDSVLGGLRRRWSVEQPPPTFKVQVQGLIQTHQEDSNSGAEAMLANAMDPYGPVLYRGLFCQLSFNPKA